MAEVNLKKLSRAELLEMMISFSEEAEKARKHEKELKESFENERIQLEHEMAMERAEMLRNFDEEKAQMREKFNQQKAELQEKFEKDIEGLKARHAREMAAKDEEVEKKLHAIKNSGTLAEAVVQLTGMMDKAKESIDLFNEEMQVRSDDEPVAETTFENLAEDIVNKVIMEAEVPQAILKDASYKEKEELPQETVSEIKEETSQEIVREIKEEEPQEIVSETVEDTVAEEVTESISEETETKETESVAVSIVNEVNKTVEDTVSEKVDESISDTIETSETESVAEAISNELNETDEISRLIDEVRKPEEKVSFSDPAFNRTPWDNAEPSINRSTWSAAPTPQYTMPGSFAEKSENDIIDDIIKQIQMPVAPPASNGRLWEEENRFREAHRIKEETPIPETPVMKEEPPIPKAPVIKEEPPIPEAAQAPVMMEEEEIRFREAALSTDVEAAHFEENIQEISDERQETGSSGEGALQALQGGAGEGTEESEQRERVSESPAQHVDSGSSSRSTGYTGVKFLHNWTQSYRRLHDANA